MHQDDEIRMTYSGIINHKGKKTVQVIFERGSSDSAEGSIPGGQITKSTGFSPEEIEELNQYLILNTNDILERARLINPMRGFIKD